MYTFEKDLSHETVHFSPIYFVLSFKKKSQQKVEEGIKKLKHKMKINRGLPWQSSG